MNNKKTHNRSKSRKTGITVATDHLILRCFRELQRRKDPVLKTEIPGHTENVIVALNCLIKLGLVESVNVIYKSNFGGDRRTSGYKLIRAPKNSCATSEVKPND